MEDNRTETTDVKKRQEPIGAETDKMEAEEPASVSETAELTEGKTDSSDKATNTDLSHASPLTSDTTSGIEVKTGSMSEDDTVPVSEAATTATADTVTDAAVEVDAAEIAVEEAAVLSPPVKNSIVGAIIKYFSPNKKDLDGSSKEKVIKPKAERSKSMAHTENVESSSTTGDCRQTAEGSAAHTEKEESLKKAGDKGKGVIKGIKKAISKMLPKRSATLEDENLVANEECIPVAPPIIPEKIQEVQSEKSESEEDHPHWTSNRESLTTQPSVAETLKTDVPSTWSGSDVFQPENERPSEGNTSEEAVAGSLASSTDELIPDIKMDAGPQTVKETVTAHKDEPEKVKLEDGVNDDLKEKMRENNSTIENNKTN